MSHDPSPGRRPAARPIAATALERLVAVAAYALLFLWAGAWAVQNLVRSLPDLLTLSAFGLLFVAVAATAGRGEHLG